MGTLTENIYYFLLILSIVTGFVFVITNKKVTSIHLLPLFFAITFGVEKYGEYLIDHLQKNYWLFNYFTVVQIFFYTWLLGTMYVSKQAQKKLLLLNIFVFIVSLTNVIFFQGIKRFHTITYGIGSIMLVASCVYYYYQLFKYPTVQQLLKQANFWIVNAMLFYFVCGFPIFVLNNIYYKKVSVVIWPTIAAISDCNNIVFYTFIIIAFLYKIKPQKITNIFKRTNNQLYTG